jgi:hypothetical protein
LLFTVVNVKPVATLAVVCGSSASMSCHNFFNLIRPATCWRATSSSSVRCAGSGNLRRSRVILQLPALATNAAKASWLVRIARGVEHDELDVTDVASFLMLLPECRLRVERLERGRVAVLVRTI